VLDRTATLGYGRKREFFTVPRRAGTYRVSIAATDLAGNSGSVAGTVRVLAPHRRA
jgi:hypothetical protein